MAKPMDKKVKSKNPPKKKVEAKVNTPKVCSVPENVINADIDCMANSICKIMTIHEVSQIIQALQQSKR